MKWCTVLGFSTNKLDQTETNTWQFFGKISKKVSESFWIFLKVCQVKNKVFFKISRTGILTRRREYLFGVWSWCNFWLSFLWVERFLQDVLFWIIKSVGMWKEYHFPSKIDWIGFMVEPRRIKLWWVTPRAYEPLETSIIYIPASYLRTVKHIMHLCGQTMRARGHLHYYYKTKIVFTFQGKSRTLKGLVRYMRILWTLAMTQVVLCIMGDMPLTKMADLQ